jgi:hypothetical protein
MHRVPGRTRALIGLVVLAALASSAPAAAGPARTSVLAVPGLRLDELDRLAERGAVGLVVPDAGPRTSQARAFESLVRGQVVNSLRSEGPSGKPLIEAAVAQEEAWPAYAAVSGARIVVGLPRGGTQRNDRRYPIALAGRRGLLSSHSTRIPGIVSIDDVARGRLRVESADDPAAELRSLDERIHDNARGRQNAGGIVALVAALLAFVRPRAAVLAVATAAATNLLLGFAGISEPWQSTTLLGLGALAAFPLERALRSPRALGLALVGVVAAYLLAMGLDASSVALSPLGPTQNGRYYGLSNALETLLLIPALAGAALLGRRHGWPAFAAAALVALVAVAGSRFGADGGGAIVLAVGFAVLGVALAGGGRRAILVAAGGAAAAVALVVADALIGPSTHVGASLRGGPDQVARDLRDRVELSWARATDKWTVAVIVAVSLTALAVLVARSVRRPAPLPVAVATAIAVSLIVNDSPKEVSVGGLVAFFVADRLARAERGDQGVAGYTDLVPSRS